MAVDGSGNLYVLDEGTVKEMPPGCTSASCVTTLGGGFGSPAAVTLDGSGNIYVTDNEPKGGGFPSVLEMPAGCSSSSCDGGWAAPATRLTSVRGC